MRIIKISPPQAQTGTFTPCPPVQKATGPGDRGRWGGWKGSRLHSCHICCYHPWSWQVARAWSLDSDLGLGRCRSRRYRFQMSLREWSPDRCRQWRWWSSSGTGTRGRKPQESWAGRSLFQNSQPQPGPRADRCLWSPVGRQSRPVEIN